MRVYDKVKEASAGYTNNGHSTELEFWLTCLKVQICEAEIAFNEGDVNHTLEEFADAVMVVIDGLTKMGYDAEQIIDDRLSKNRKKNLGNRDLVFYQRKLEALQNQLRWRE